MSVITMQQFQQQYNPYVQRIYEESEKIRISLGAESIDQALQIVNQKLREQEEQN